MSAIDPAGGRSKELSSFVATRPFYGQVSIRQPNTPTSEPRERIFGWQYTFFLCIRIFGLVFTRHPRSQQTIAVSPGNAHPPSSGVSRGVRPLTPSVLCLHCVARCTQLLPTPQGMPLTASHAPLLTLHMLWIDLSKSFMTFSRAVGQLLQASRGVRAQVRKGGTFTAGPHEDSRSAQLFLETSRTCLLGT